MHYSSLGDCNQQNYDPRRLIHRCGVQYNTRAHTHTHTYTCPHIEHESFIKQRNQWPGIESIGRLSIFIFRGRRKSFDNNSLPDFGWTVHLHKAAFLLHVSAIQEHHAIIRWIRFHIHRTDSHRKKQKQRHARNQLKAGMTNPRISQSRL